MEVVNRCVPDISQYESQSSWTCDGEPISDADKYTCQGMLTETTVSTMNTTAGSQVLLGSLVSTSYTIGEYLNDVGTTVWYVFGYGLLMAVVVSLLYVILLKYIAGCLVWSIVFVIWVLSLIISTIGFIKGGTFFGVGS